MYFSDNKDNNYRKIGGFKNQSLNLDILNNFRKTRGVPIIYFALLGLLFPY